jgi:hypothetical protein
MSVEAARHAIRRAGIDPAKIGAIIYRVGIAPVRREAERHGWWRSARGDPGHPCGGLRIRLQGGQRGDVRRHVAGPSEGRWNTRWGSGRHLPGRAGRRPRIFRRRGAAFVFGSGKLLAVCETTHSFMTGHARLLAQGVTSSTRCTAALHGRAGLFSSTSRGAPRP